MEGDRERCLAAGMDGYVSKPFNLSELLKTISELTASSMQRVSSMDAGRAPSKSCGVKQS
jgi:CheY-like chemotaxis protein